MPVSLLDTFNKTSNLPEKLFVVYPFNLFISVIKDLGLSTTKVGEI